MVQIGNITVETIYELDASKVIRDVITEATPKNIQAIGWLAPNYADENGNLKAVNQSFLLRAPDYAALIDPCVGNGRPRPGFLAWDNLQTDYLANLTKAIDPNEVDFVICTHLHFDHIGWNTVLKDGRWTALFPNAKYVFMKEEFDYWMSSPKKEYEDDLSGIDESVKPLIEAGLIKLVRAGEQFTDEIRLISTPGHTPFHASVRVESEGQTGLFAGDVFHHPCQIANPDWTSFDTDENTALATRAKFLKEFADTNITVFGAHFAEPAGGKIITSGTSYKLQV